MFRYRGVYGRLSWDCWCEFVSFRSVKTPGHSIEMSFSFNHGLILRFQFCIYGKWVEHFEHYLPMRTNQQNTLTHLQNTNIYRYLALSLSTPQWQKCNIVLLSYLSMCFCVHSFIHSWRMRFNAQLYKCCLKATNNKWKHLTQTFFFPIHATDRPTDGTNSNWTLLFVDENWRASPCVVTFERSSTMHFIK